MEGAEFASLVEDIRAHGQVQPLVMYQGKILDGRNRARACEKIGIKPKTVDYRGTDPLGYVLSLNLARRHLNESQRAMVAARVSEWSSAGGDRRSADQAANLPNGPTNLPITPRRLIGGGRLPRRGCRDPLVPELVGADGKLCRMGAEVNRMYRPPPPDDAKTPRLEVDPGLSTSRSVVAQHRMACIQAGGNLWLLARHYDVRLTSLERELRLWRLAQVLATPVAILLAALYLRRC